MLGGMPAKTPEDPFIARATATIDKLMDEERALAAQEEGVRRRRLALQQLVADWQRSIALYSDAMGLSGDATPGQVSAALDAPEGSVVELAERYLREHGGTAKIKDVVRWLVAVGKLSSEAEKSGQNYGAVYTAVLRHPERFKRIGRGEFELTAESS
jgi:hypothetical protein